MKDFRSIIHCGFYLAIGLPMAAAFGQDATSESSEAAPTPEGIAFFESKIRPVLVAQCYQCHSKEGQGLRGGLAVDSRDALHAGGESGPAIVPGKLDESLLWSAINYQDFEMPPKRRLPPEVIADFRKWIEMGAPDPRVVTGTIVRSRVTPEEIEKGKTFWAYQKPVVRAPKNEQHRPWGVTDIDEYVVAGWNEHALEPAEDAVPHHLVRRLYFDLVGLPPTIEETREFEAAYAENRDTAIQAVVDRLLESDRFGERWGRYWLDVARYAESTGKEVDMTFPDAWRYRNYVIDSFNKDKPYDQFIREQIAGDLLPAKDDKEWAEHLIATGFLALGPKALIEQNPRQFQADLIDEQIDATTRVVLGISVACARCHDHKFDPIPQEDYYALAGIFQSTETFFGGTRSQRNRQPSNLLVLPINDPSPQLKPVSKQQLAEWLQELRTREAEYAEARRAQRQGTPPNAKDAKPGNDPARNFLNIAILDQLVAVLSSRLNSYDENGEPLTTCLGVQANERPRNARLLVRGEIDQPAQEVARGFVRVLSDSPATIPAQSSGRLELAQWMTHRDNPLTARVMVNRIWQHLIGSPLVRETDNFGMSGPGPTHPELLDYLAIRFMDQQWSVKQLIRDITASRVYSLASTFDEKRWNADPDNHYLARANVRRLDAEAMRDAMLMVSGQLEIEPPRASLIASYGTTMLGPNGPVAPPPGLLNMTGERPNGEMLAMARARFQNGANPLDAPNYHRSVYLPIARNSLPRSLDVFDFAEPSIIVGERESSHTAEQALFMLNNPFVIEQSDALARRLIREYPDERLGAAFRLVYGRPATATELRRSSEFIRDAAARLPGGTRDQRNFRALSEFCQALLASAEFRFLD